MNITEFVTTSASAGCLGFCWNTCVYNPVAWAGVWDACFVVDALE